MVLAVLSVLSRAFFQGIHCSTSNVEDSPDNTIVPLSSPLPTPLPSLTESRTRAAPDACLFLSLRLWPHCTDPVSSLDLVDPEPPRRMTRPSFLPPAGCAPPDFAPRPIDCWGSSQRRSPGLARPLCATRKGRHATGWNAIICAARERDAYRDLVASSLRFYSRTRSLLGAIFHLGSNRGEQPGWSLGGTPTTTRPSPQGEPD